MGVDPPSVPTLAPASDSGTTGDNLTKFTTPQITGNGEAGATVTLFDGGSNIGSGKVAAGGTWSIVTATLAAGPHSITAVQTEDDGSSGPSAALAFTIDNITPGAPLGLLLTQVSNSGKQGDNLTNKSKPIFSGTGEIGATVTLFDRGNTIGTGIVGANGVWFVTATTALTAGVNPITATQTDLAGNTSVPSGALNVTLDTTVLPPAGLVLAPTSDSGVKGDNVTNVLLPTFTGTGEVGATVMLSDAVATIGTGTVAADGTWSIAVTARLTEGINVITATQTDLAGNISAPSAALDVMLNTRTPAKPASLLLAAASDTGAQGDNITNVAKPTFSGTGEIGATVTLYDGGIAIGSATVTAGAIPGPFGVWSSAVSTALNEGVNTITATQTSANGNTSASTALVVTLDTIVQAPAGLALTLASDSSIVGDGTTDVGFPTISGTGGETGATVTLLDDGATIGTGIVGAAGAWSVTASTALKVGANNITATQTDVAGNKSVPSVGLSVTLETTASPPAGLALAPGSDSGIKDNITNVALPTISGTGENGAIVTLRDGGTVIGTGPVSGGNWSITTTALTEGANSITATQTDVAGTSPASAALNVILDTTALPPAALALTPASDSGTKGDSITDITVPTISGTGENGATVTLFEGNTAIGTGTVGASGAWLVTATTALNAGVNHITAKQTDQAGNTSFASATLDVTLVAVDITAPAAPAGLLLTVPSNSGKLGDNLTNKANPTISGTGEIGATVTLLDGNIAIGTGVVDATGAWLVTATKALTQGFNLLTAKQFDQAGNTSVASAALNVTLDTTVLPPAGMVLAPASDSGVKLDNVTNVLLPTLTGSGENGATVMLSDAGATIGTGTVTGGRWSIAPTTRLTEGINVITATQTDLAGNISAPSAALDVTLNTRTPAKPANLLLAAASDTGGQSDNITNVANPTFSGTGEIGATVTLHDGGKPIGSATVTAGATPGPIGVWSIANTALHEGVNTITATQTSANGSTSVPSDALLVTLDTIVQAPAGLALTPESDSGIKGDGITDVSLPTISGNGGETGATVALLLGGATMGTGIVGAAGAWSITASTALSEGLNAITATQTDVAGNKSVPSAGLSVILQTTASPPAGLALAAGSDSGIQGDNITNVARPIISGSGEEGATVTLFDGNGTIGRGTVADGRWSITATKALTEGTNVITAKQTDTDGNISIPSTTLAVTLDTTAPAAPSAPDLAAASDSGASNTDHMTNVALPTFSGTGIEGATVTLLDGATMIGTGTVTGGAWSIASATALTEGANAITATETDAAGNVSTSSAALNVTLDITPPVVTAVTASPSEAILGAGSLVNLALGVSETVLVAGGTPTLTLNNGGTATYASGSGTSALLFNYTVAGGADVPDLAITGVNLNGATVTDQAGNAADLTGAAVNPAGTLAIEPTGIAAFDTTTKQPVAVVGQAYTGPVAGLEREYINVTSHNLNVSTGTPNWFIHSGSGDDAIAVSSGTNVLDGGTGSNFLTGGSGTDTFFVDDHAAPADIWSTVNNFQAGDAATIWGVTPQDFGLAWVDGQGAAGFTGLTLHATAAGRPAASLTLAGYSQADLGNGRLSVMFGADPASGSAYMYVHGNG